MEFNDDIAESVVADRYKQMFSDLHKKISKLEGDKQDMLVVIDTLQTNLRSAVSAIPEENRKSIIEVQSYKWCIDWKP